MLQHYFLLAWRYLGKNRGYTTINIAGLSIGMGIALVIGLWITDEANFDHYAPNHSRLAAGMLNMRLNNATKKEEFFTGQTIMMPLGNTLNTQYKGRRHLCGSSEEYLLQRSSGCLSLGQRRKRLPSRQHGLARS
jgi:putative ABC transport system permease protein